MRRSGMLVVVCVGAIIGLLAGPAVAAPTFLGPTGLIRTPTADALGEAEYNIAFFTLDETDGSGLDVWALNYGFADGLEVGFARLSPEYRSSETYLNAKYTFQSETEPHPAVAVGLVDITDESDTTAYVALSKALRRGCDMRYGEIVSPRIHFGIGGGQLDGVFGGVSAGVAKRILLMAEYDTADFNVGVNWSLGRDFKVHGAVLNDFDDWGVGISFNKWS